MAKISKLVLRTLLATSGWVLLLKIRSECLITDLKTTTRGLNFWFGKVFERDKVTFLI